MPREAAILDETATADYWLTKRHSEGRRRICAAEENAAQFADRRAWAERSLPFTRLSFCAESREFFPSSFTPLAALIFSVRLLNRGKVFIAMALRPPAVVDNVERNAFALLLRNRFGEDREVGDLFRSRHTSMITSLIHFSKATSRRCRCRPSPA